MWIGAKPRWNYYVIRVGNKKSTGTVEIIWRHGWSILGQHSMKLWPCSCHDAQTLHRFSELGWFLHHITVLGDDTSVCWYLPRSLTSRPLSSRSHHAVLLPLPASLCLLPTVVHLLPFVPNFPLEQESVKKKGKKGEFWLFLNLEPNELRFVASEGSSWTCGWKAAYSSYPLWLKRRNILLKSFIQNAILLLTNPVTAFVFLYLTIKLF